MSGYNNEQLDRLEPAYLASLGLQQPPFTSSHEHKFLYLDAERDQCDNMLHHLAQYSNLLLIVSGERGIGKTSLLEHFVATAMEEWSLCQVQANAMMDAHQLLASIARGFGLQAGAQPADTLHEMLYQYLATIQHNGRIPILLVDDAHELPKDALETLFTLADTETGEDSLLRIILFCEPQIEIMLESPAIQPLRERITHTIEIPAFNEEQTAEYIKHRMAVSGFTGTSPFLPRDIKKIHKVSRGVPARINELAHLHLSGDKQLDNEPEQLPEEYAQLSFSTQRLAIGIIFITLVLGVLLFQDKINNLFEDSPQVETVELKIPEPAETPTVPETPPVEKQTVEILTPSQQQEATTDTGVEVTETGTKNKSADMVEASPGQEPQVSDITSSAPPAEVASTPAIKSSIRSILPNPVTGSSEKQTLLVNGEGFTKDTRITVSWSGNKKQLSSEQVKYENANQLQIFITVGRQADKWTIQADDPLHGQSKPFQFDVSAAPVTGLQNIKWINQQNPQHFTLQLLGTYNKTSLVSFVKQHKLDINTAYFVTQREGKDWYTLVHGQFESKTAAQQAITRLPASLQKTRPWIRRFSDIQSTQSSVQSSNSQVPVETTQPAAVTAATNDKLAGQPLDLTANAAWLWSQNPGHYTLQLLGSHKLEALRAFTSKHNISKQTTYYRTRRNNREWFVLLYGTYAEKEQARQAIGRLPVALQETKPWPRRFADIHAELSSQ